MMMRLMRPSTVWSSVTFQGVGFSICADCAPTMAVDLGSAAAGCAAAGESIALETMPVVDGAAGCCPCRVSFRGS